MAAFAAILFVACCLVLAPTARTTCVPFNLNIGFNIQYNLTISPNPLSPDYLSTLEVTQREAEAAIKLANRSCCSAYIAEFILYTYLPQCYSTATLTVLVYPCSDFCERMRACCGASMTAAGLKWPEWMDCSKIATAVSANQNVCYRPPRLQADTKCPSSTPVAATELTTLASESADPQAESQESCVPFSLHVGNCSRNYYNLSYFPNPLNADYLPNVDRALYEIRLLLCSAVATKCSKYIGEFLMFSYLPQCFALKSSVLLVFPCKDFCKAVRSCCEARLLDEYGISWPWWLDCEKMARISADHHQNICYRPPDVSAISQCPPPTPRTESSVTSTTKAPPTTAKPTQLSCPCTVSCQSCVIRSNVTSATFTVQNYDYDFAAKVIVTGKRDYACNITYEVNVLENYLPCPNSSIRSLPSINAVLTTYNRTCASCFDLAIGETYWVGGIYYINCRDVPVWEIPRTKGVAAIWATRYDSKGSTWVDTARREHGC